MDDTGPAPLPPPEDDGSADDGDLAMPDLADCFFGTIALKNRLLTREELSRCLEIQAAERRSGVSRTLGEICLEEQLLSEVDVAMVLKAQARSEVLLKDVLCGQIAVRNQLVTQPQLDEALRLQRKDGYRYRVGTYLIRLGYLTAQEVDAVLRAQARLRTPPPPPPPGRAS